MKNEKAEIVVVGGGIGGVCAALELSKRSCRVTLVEASSDILSKTSAITPGRFGLGFHYPNDSSLATAIKCIQAATIFAQDFPHVFRDTSTNVKYGRYFVTKDSFVSGRVFSEYCHKIKKLYELFSNKTDDFFFTDDRVNFYRILDPVEYQHSVNVNNIELGVETSERLINWQTLDLLLRQRLREHKDNINILTEHKVSNITQSTNGYELLINNAGNRKSVYASVLVNATCGNRLLLDNMVFSTAAGLWSNRLKFLVNIELPTSLFNECSMFFCVGPGAMFTNNGNGTGYITYAPVTNYAVSDAVFMPCEWEKYLMGNIPAIQQSRIADAIIAGVANYIPEMRKAKVRRVMAGIVQSKGDANIYDPQSDMHRRDQSGIYVLAPNYYSFDTGKLVFASMHAKFLAETICRKMI